MSMNTVPERLAALREAMKANGVDVYLIPVGDPHASEYMPDHYTALTYFSGFHGENSNFVVTMTESAVWADGRYFVQAEKEIAGTEIQLMRMGEPGVPTAEQYCGKVLPEGGKLGLCGLTASCGLVRSLQKELDAKKGTIKLLNLEDELWTEGRPALPATPAWLLPKEYAGFSPAEKLGQLRAKLSELGCTAQLVGKLDNLAWLLNLRAMDIQCTPYAMAYCYVTPNKATLFINTARVSAEAAAELKENGVELAEYDDVLTFLAAQAEEQTVLADPVSVNYAVYQTLQANPALTVKDEADPLLPMKGVKNEVELAHTREAHIRDGVAMVRFQIELENRLAAGGELTELTIDEILHKYRSAQDKFLTESFGTIAAYGPNAAMMHYHATEEDHAKLEKKGFLLVDSGATYMDGTTDITRTYPLGGLTEDERLFYTWTLQCHIDIARAVWLDYCDGHMLDTLGDRKTALFIIISDTDDTFNFLASMVYTQLFNLLCDKADDVYGGRLPVHVRCLIDECANIGQIPKLEKLMATIRSREISACLVLQAQSQLKALYKDNCDTIIGNCDSSVFLGGKEPTTLKELSAALGKETIDTFNTGESRGREVSHSLNYQKLGKELMSQDELAVLNGGKCILQLRGVRPFLSDKYDITKHPNYKYLSDANPKNAFDIEKFLSTKLKLKPEEEFEVFDRDAATGSESA